jgi:ParB/RepB/Spo0J family partition protein
MSNAANETNPNARKISMIQAKKIHVSNILPGRSHGKNIEVSVKRVGILQPLIVREIKDSPGEYELIDGHGRFESLEQEQFVLVEIISANDTEVFDISHATFQRKERTTFERAQFYHNWFSSIVKKNGAVLGAQAELAKSANRTEGLISQYLSVHKLFEKLQNTVGIFDFTPLKSMDLNRLYKLSKLLEDPRLPEIAKSLINFPSIPFDDLKLTIDNTQSPQTASNSSNLQDSKEGSNSTESSNNNPNNSNMKEIASCQLVFSPKKLDNLLNRATNNLGEVAPKLSNVLVEISSTTEKYYSAQTLKIMKRILRLLKKLDSCAQTLSSINQTTESTKSSQSMESVLD